MDAIANFPETVGTLLFTAPLTTEVLCKDFVHSKKGSAVHAYWAYPLNGIVTLITLPLAPLFSLVALVAAGIFKLIDFCAGENSEIDWGKATAEALKNSRESLIGMGIIFVRIFYAPCEY